MILLDTDIKEDSWSALVKRSSTANWFQTVASYRFYSSLPEMMTPFAVGVSRSGGSMAGIAVGYITKERNHLKQCFTRRAIIIGGPMLSDDITDAELSELLLTLRRKLSHHAIYIETRNFNDYSRWRKVFEQCGFAYQPHLNFHIDTSSIDIVEQNLGKSRKRDIRTSFRDGVTIIEQPTREQLAVWYDILKRLYTTKIHTPLFPLSFFERLFESDDGRLLLVELNGEIIGGTACVALEGKCLYEWFVCGRDGEWKSVFPSSVATYAGICYAARNGMPRFDMMGAGTPDEAYGVRDFKSRFGGKEVEHGRFLYVAQPLLYKIGKLGVKWLKR